jgi:hypothetical protein
MSVDISVRNEPCVGCLRAGKSARYTDEDDPTGATSGAIVCRDCRDMLIGIVECYGDLGSYVEIEIKPALEEVGIVIDVEDNPED